MTWESRYLLPDPTMWNGRADIPADSCFYQHVQPINLLTQKPEHSKNISFALVGFKCDEGVARDLGRTGAAEGPTAIRHRLAKLPLQRPDIHCYDVGSIICTDHDLEASQQALADVIALLLSRNIRPIVIGGGHEVAWGHYQGIARVYPPEKQLGIINFDAHFDLHPMSPSHRGSATTAFFQIAEAQAVDKRRFDYNCIGIQHVGNIRQSFDIAKQLKTKMILADEMHLGLQEKCVDFVDRVIDETTPFM